MDIDDLMEEIRDLIEDASVDQQEEIANLKGVIDDLEEEVAELQVEWQEKDMEIERLREMIND